MPPKISNPVTASFLKNSKSGTQVANTLQNSVKDIAHLLNQHEGDKSQNVQILSGRQNTNVNVSPKFREVAQFMHAQNTLKDRARVQHFFDTNNKMHVHLSNVPVLDQKISMYPGSSHIQTQGALGSEDGTFRKNITMNNSHFSEKKTATRK
jgi:hypothetical protein